MNLVDIKINGEFLDLDEATFRFEMQSSLFSPTAAPVFFSFPVSIPGTPGNHRRLNFGYLSESYAKLQRDRTVELWLDGNYWFTCILCVDSYRTGFYDANVTSGVTLKNKDMLDLPMREIDFGAYNAYQLPEKKSFYLAQIDWPDGDALGIRLTRGGSHTDYSIAWTGDAAAMIDALLAAINADESTHHFLATAHEGYSVPSAGVNEFVLLLQGQGDGVTPVTSFAALGTVTLTQRLLCLQNFAVEHPEHTSNILLHKTNVTRENQRAWYEAVYGKVPYRFPVIYNPDAGGYNWRDNLDETGHVIDAADNEEFSPLLNEWYISTTAGVQAATNSNVWDVYPPYTGKYKNHAWCTKVSFIIERIFKTWGLKVNNSFFSTLEGDNLILVSLAKLGGVFYLSGSFEKEIDFILDLRMTMPDITVREFMEGLKVLFGLTFTYNFAAGTVDIDCYRNVLARGARKNITAQVTRKPEAITSDGYADGFTLSFDHDSNDKAVEELTKKIALIKGAPVATVADLPDSDAPETMRLVTEEDNYYRLVAGVDGAEWKFYCTNLIPKVIGAGGTEITSAVTPVSMKKDVPQSAVDFRIEPHAGDETTRKLRMPYIDQPMRRLTDAKDENTFGARIAFYRERCENGYEAGHPYPYASNDTVDYNGDMVGTVSLKWDTPTGLYETFLRTYYDLLMATTLYSADIQYSINDLRTLNMNECITIESTQFFYNKISVVVDNKQKKISPAAVEIYKR